MLSRKFNLISQEIKNNNFTLASQILDAVKVNLVSKADIALYDALSLRIRNNHEEKKQPTYLGDNLSDLDNREVIPGISIVSCCMNRNDNLLKSLETWIKLPVDEIVIVDWSSLPAVSETIKNVNDNRIKIIRIENEARWILTYGFNVGLRFASYSKIYKLDADIQVNADFLEKNAFDSNSFVRGFWKSAYDNGDSSQVYVNGSFGANKKSLKEIGYYNEYIRTYGWDDSDLYERLAHQCGLKTQYLSYHSLRHLEQEEEERTINQDVVTDDYLGIIKATTFNNMRNKFIARLNDYWNLSRVQDYKLIENFNNLWVYQRTTQHRELPKYMMDRANSHAAIHFLWAQQAQLIAKSPSDIDFAYLMLNEYLAKVNFETTKLMLGESDVRCLIKVFTSDYGSYSTFLGHCKVVAEKHGCTVFAIAKGEYHKHEKFGYHGSLVEAVVLEEYLYNIVAHYWSLNGVVVDNAKFCITVNKDEFSQGLALYQKRLIYVDAQHGLGNRIRAIGSAAAIAKSANRELVIVWEPDHHCECRFAELFDYDGKVIEKSFVDCAPNYMDVFNYMEIEPNAQKGKEILLKDEKDLYLRAAYTFNHSSSHWDNENEFIRALIPTAAITNIVNQFNLENCLAAHVRMEAGKGLDHNTYDSIENWTAEGHDEIHFWRDKSHFSNFIKRIDKLLEADDELSIFLATDLKENYQVFEDYYGEKLKYLKRDLYDRSAEQIKYALADAILLSKCNKLLGSTWSSFSELAMRLSSSYDEIEMSGRDF